MGWTPKSSTTKGRTRAVAVATLVLGTVAAACVPPPPGTVSGTVAVQAGADAVNHLDVTLDLTISGGPTEMRVANGADPSGAPWRTVASPLPWTLADGADGTRTVSVQFRLGTTTSAVVTDTITLDRTAPDLAITTVTNGQQIDVRNGEPFLFGGTSSDAGTGVAGVTMSVVGQAAPDPAELRPDGTWAHPAAADVTGTFTYVATATDRAGNAASRQVSLTVTVPDPTQTLQRPGVRRFGPAEQAAVTLVDTAGARLELHGDLRGFLAGGTVIVSEPFALAPDGLIRRIRGVAYDLPTDTTTVSTELGQLFDVFSQLDVDTDAAPSARANASAAPTNAAELCNQFVAGKTIGISKALEGETGTHEIGPAHASFHAGLAAAAYADFKFKVKLGWSGISVKRVRAVMGMKLCADAGMSLSLSLEDALRALGQEWTVGIPKSTLDSLHIDTLGPSSFGFAPGHEKQAKLVTPPIPILGVPVRGALGLQIGPVIELPVETDLEGLAGASFVGGVDYHDGGTDLIADPDLDLKLRQVTVVDSARLGFGVQVSAGVKMGEFVTADLFSVNLEPTIHIDAHWDNDWVGSTSYVNRIDAKLCADISGNLGLTLQAGVGPWTVTLLNLKPVTIAEAHPCYHLDPLLFGGALQITTTSLPEGHTGQAYLGSLAANSSPVRWSLDDGALPSGLTLDPTGAISGIPTTPGTYDITVRATEPGGRTKTKALQIVITGNPITAGTGWNGGLGLDPTWACPPWAKIGAGGVMFGNVLHFDSSTASETNAYIQSGSTLAFPSTWIIEANMRLNRSTSSFPQRTGAGIAFANGNGVGNSLQFGPSGIFLAAGNMTNGASASVDTAGFHNYRIEVTTTSGAINVYQDGNLVLSGSTFSSTEFNGTEPRIEFGDGSTLASGSSDWHSVTHNAVTSCRV